VLSGGPRKTGLLRSKLLRPIPELRWQAAVHSKQKVGTRKQKVETGKLASQKRKFISVIQPSDFNFPNFSFQLFHWAHFVPVNSQALFCSASKRLRTNDY